MIKGSQILTNLKGTPGTVVNTTEEDNKTRAALEFMMQDKIQFANFWRGVSEASRIEKDTLHKAKFVPNRFRTMPSRKSLSIGETNNDVVIAKQHSKAVLQQERLFNPDGTRKIVWDVLLGCLILYSVIIIPFRIGFDQQVTDSMFIFDSIIDGLFFIDIILNFNTTYVEVSTELLVTDRTLIAKHYLQFWFWVDLFSTIPFDTIISTILGGDRNSNLSSLKLIRILRLTRMLKLLRVLKLTKIGKVIENYNINPALVGVGKLVLQICFLGHLLSCFWFFMTTDDGGAKPGGRKWTDYGDIKTLPVAEQYVAAFYWTITTMLAIGYGDIIATNSRERVYSIFTMLMGSIMFGAMIAQVTRLIESRNPQARAFKEKMDELKAYLNEKHLPKTTKVAAKEAYAYFLTKKSAFAESGIFADLPALLLNRLVLSVYHVERTRISLFRNYQESFVVHLIQQIKPFQAPPGTLVVEKGDVPDELICVMRGIVQFKTTNGVVDSVTGYATEGGYFGDFEYYKKTTRHVSHMAVCNCNLLAIPTSCLDEAIKQYPIPGDRFQTELDLRYKNFLTAKASPHVPKSGGIFIKTRLWVDGRIEESEDSTSSHHKSITDSQIADSFFRTVRMNYVTQEEEHAEEHVEDLGRRMILYPKGDVKIKWDFVVGGLILYSVLVIPIQIGFGRESQGGLYIFDIVIDCFFGMDMILAMRTAYFDEYEDAFITVPKRIISHYFVTWFWVDFFSVFPFDIVLAAATNSSGAIYRTIKLIKVIRLARLLKLARLAKLRKYLNKLEDNLGINPATFDLLKMIIEVLFIGHIIACSFWFITDSMNDYTWFDAIDMRDAPLHRQYITAVYWTFTTLATVGYGDIVPVQTTERCIVILIMILGATVFGYIVANVSTLMGSLDVTSARVNARIAEVTEYLTEKGAPGIVSSQIIKHVRYMFTQNSAFDENSIFGRLPLHLCRKIIYLQHADTLSKIAIFRYISNRGIVLYLFRLMTPVFYDVDQYVVRQGEMAFDLIFLVMGKARMFRTHDVFGGGAQGNRRNGRRRPIKKRKTYGEAIVSYVCDLGPGDFLGHVSLRTRKPFTASVRAAIPCSAYCLSEYTIATIMRDFPAVLLPLQTALGKAINAQRNTGKLHARNTRAGFLADIKRQFIIHRSRRVAMERAAKKGTKELFSTIVRMNSKDTDLNSSRSIGTMRRVGSVGNIYGKIPSSKDFVMEVSKRSTGRRSSLALPVLGNLLEGNEVAQSTKTQATSSNRDSLSGSSATIGGTAKASLYASSDPSSPMAKDGEGSEIGSVPKVRTMTATPIKVKPKEEAKETGKVAPEPEPDAASPARPRKWSVVRGLVHDPAAMALVRSESNVESKDDVGDLRTRSGEDGIRKMPSRAPSNRKPLKQPSAFSMVNAVKATLDQKRKRVLLLADGNEFYDSDDEMSPLKKIKIRALRARHRSCENLSHLDDKNDLAYAGPRLKRRTSFPSLDVDVWKQTVRDEVLL